MTRRLRSILLFVLWGLPAISLAEGLLDVFNLAIENDPQLRAAMANRDAIKEAKAQAFADFLPSVNSTASVTQYYQVYDLYLVYFENGAPPVEASYGLNMFKSYQGYLTLRQPVFDMELLARNKTANLEVTRSVLGYRIAQQELIYRVIERYFEVLQKTGDLNFARAEKKAVARQLRTTKARFDAGLIAVTDVHEAQARHDLSVALEIMSESELALAEEKMREVTGQSPKQLFPLREETPLVPPTPTNINDWVNAARLQNLRIAEQQLKADVANQRINEIKARYFPKFDITANGGYVDYGGAYSQVYKDANVSLNMNMELYKGGRTRSEIRQARKQHESESHTLDQIEREVLTETRSAYLGVLAGMSYVKAINQATQSSGKALAATEAGFDVGTRTAVQVMDAQRELFRNQRDYAHARYQYILNTLKLKKAVGLLTIDDIEQINSWLQ
ncbi:MAG: TolC family outer membrane protein [Gammaproteobacteria bacterium]|nr:TolC family outer membrane protein [Gammaproteobacteria bacterium]